MAVEQGRDQVKEENENGARAPGAAAAASSIHPIQT